MENGKKVLFSGTGCQVNGLKCFLKSDYDNLTCIDVICHGVPSQALWEKYAKWQESRHGKLKLINFRCKDSGWTDFEIKENKLLIPKDLDYYMQMFLRNFSLRPSCYSCHAKIYKISDVSIADFWGIDEIAPEMNDGDGVSLVITRTLKGQALFDATKDVLTWKEVDYEDAVKYNPTEHESVQKPVERALFYSDMKSMTFQKFAKKYIRFSRKRLMKQNIKRIILRWGGGVFIKGNYYLSNSLKAREKDYRVYSTLLDFYDN